MIHPFHLSPLGSAMLHELLVGWTVIRVPLLVVGALVMLVGVVNVVKGYRD